MRAKLYTIKIKIFSFVVLFAACNMGNNTNSILETSNLNITETKYCNVIDSVVIPLPFNLWDWKVMNNKEIALFSQGNEHYCTLYDIEDSCVMYTMASKGKGREEYLTCNWCKTTQENIIALYDIMSKKLNIYNIQSDGWTKEKTYILPTDEDGLTYPYTSIVHYDNSKYLLKEDGIETNLRLVDLKNGDEIASYHCSFRDGKDGSYTPYDYLFHVTGDKIIISYCYFDRIEVLQINNEKGIIPIISYGSDETIIVPEDYNNLKYHNLYIETRNSNFYILRSLNGREEGNEIIALNAENQECSIIKLQKAIKLFGFDQEGDIWGYNESDVGSIIYKFQQ